MADPEDAASSARPQRGREAWPARAAALAAVLAGPALIVAAGLFVQRDVAFRGLIALGDAARYWLPMHCFLGRGLAAGHVPGWNPHVLSGTPFSADPQSGWMALLPMALFGTLSCGAAIRWEVVAPPVLAGLGLYWFLRGEGASRPAAAVGGLALTLAVAGTRLPSSIRFPEAMAWTSLALAAASRFLRTRTWPARLAWVLPTAVAWGQVAASHITVGFLIGSLALVAFLAARLGPHLRPGGGRSRDALASLLVLVAALPLVNLAYFLPRLVLTPHTSLGLGYAALSRLSRGLTGLDSPAFPGFGAGATWPLNFATYPGLHFGAAVLGLSFAGWWSKTHRPLVAAFSAFGTACYLLGLRVVSHNVPGPIRSISVVDQYLHEPYWLSFGVLLSVAVLAALGLEAWREAHGPRARVLMIAPAIVCWIVLPLAFGASPRTLEALAVGAVLVGALLAAGLRWGAVTVAMPLLVLAEMMTAILRGDPFLPFPDAPNLLVAATPPIVSVDRYLRQTSISQTLRARDSGRYLTLGLPGGQRWGDPLSLQNNEAMLLGLDNVGGYQAVQLLRYWLFLRTVQRAPTRYNYATAAEPKPLLLDLLDVHWLVHYEGRPFEPGAVRVLREDPWVLRKRTAGPPRASVVGSWTVAPSSAAALHAVTSPAFNPEDAVVLERDPGLPPSGPPGSSGDAFYRSLGAQAARVDVEASAPSIVLVRNVFDPNWHATVDGRPGRVLAADYVDQGVPVPAGRHTIVLTYDDPTIGFGAVGSAATLAVLLGLAWFLRRRRTGTTPPFGPDPPPGPPGPSSPAAP